MSFTKMAAAAAVVGVLGFAGRADAQVITTGGTYYSTSPGVVYSSGYSYPSVVYPAGYSYPTYGGVYSSGYSYPYATNYYSGYSYPYSNWNTGYYGGYGVSGYNNIYGNQWGTGLNVGTRGAMYNGIRLGRWR